MPINWDPSHDWDRYVRSQEPPPAPRCEKCKAFLPFEPDDHYPYSVEEDEIEWVPDHQTNEYVAIKTGKRHVVAAGTVLIRICRRCGHQNEWSN